ncbi:transaldolase [Georgenia sp. 311]|uniref:Transaldolase n=1 Tax=Georgenia wutianyii TaxID=2585135 RepID=A0ABX5VQH2_9MICO|nr:MULTISPECIES: transaldolase [Georgenia]QDB79304.1 transaldolase [Georgenia wutianyii]TNC17384.1 transaldolase [Georgenia sp. 311]
MTNHLAELSDLGVSVWLDDLSRERLEGGGAQSLSSLIADDHVVGVTTNPSIFASAMSEGTRYDADLARLAGEGADVPTAITSLTTADVRAACDCFAEVSERSDGVDGRVSIEVDPYLAHDTDATLAQARELWRLVDRRNLLVKVPATLEGLPAITAATAEGISVNVTLIFSLDRYRAVALAYVDGLERAHEAGVDLSTIHSVASFFVSRIDTAIDARLDELDSEDARALRGKVAVANARLAHEAYEEIFGTERWADLAAAGARPQRLLWASTGVKDPAYPDTKYVEELVVPGVVNTMPESTLRAVADHARLSGDTVHGREDEAREVLASLERYGISYRDVMEALEAEGVAKFQQSWDELGERVRTGLEAPGRQ